MAQLTPHQIAAERSAQLLQQAMDVFLRLGIRSVNMAELASEMGGFEKDTLHSF